mmetsp:Transcript_120763/g.376027  ORF Transcript_120763/g.376027 Transcript_120763/m.376027 type:complete len:244 (+) Transcript_120763:754-1485(+)
MARWKCAEPLASEAADRRLVARARAPRHALGLPLPLDAAMPAAGRLGLSVAAHGSAAGAPAPVRDVRRLLAAGGGRSDERGGEHRSRGRRADAPAAPRRPRNACRRLGGAGARAGEPALQAVRFVRGAVEPIEAHQRGCFLANVPGAGWSHVVALCLDDSCCTSRGSCWPPARPRALRPRIVVLVRPWRAADAGGGPANLMHGQAAVPSGDAALPYACLQARPAMPSGGPGSGRVSHGVHLRQ